MPERVVDYWAATVVHLSTGADTCAHWCGEQFKKELRRGFPTLVRHVFASVNA